MPKKHKNSGNVRKVIAGILGLLGMISLLGELGITSFGKTIYALLKYPLGDLAWLGPFLFFILALILALSAPIRPRSLQDKGGRVRSANQAAEPRKVQKSAEASKSRREPLHKEPKALPKSAEKKSSASSDTRIPLPKAKMVTLKGFNDYFATPEGPEIREQEPLQELADVGKDFPTYFREGNEHSLKPLGTRLSTVQGFPNYFDEVSAELEEELKKYARPDAGRLFPPQKEWESSYLASQDYHGVAGQVSQLFKLEKKERPAFAPPDVRETSGVTYEERAELLGKAEPEASSVPLKTPAGSVDLSVTLSSESLSVATSAKTYPGYPETQAFSEVQVSRDFPEVPQGQELHEPHEPQERPGSGSQGLHEPHPYHERPNQERHTPPELPEPQVVQVQTEFAESPADRSGHSVSQAAPAPAAVKPTQPHGSPGELENRAQAMIQPKDWRLPEVSLLDPAPPVAAVVDSETQRNLERVLEDFGVQAKVIRVARGPVITRYELAPAPGVKISRIVNLADDIALGLAARDVRIEAPIPGKAAVGIEVPNKQPRSVHFREVLETEEYRDNPSKLKIALGKDIANQAVAPSLAKMPHLLVAGATGSGKSVCITALINSLLFNARPDEVKFLMVDPKMVELSLYNGIPHLLAPVVTDPKKAAAALKWVVKEMETRYELFAASGVRDIERYNRLKATEPGNAHNPAPALPWIVVIIDELADLMMVAADEVEEAICRLAQMARAAGIHLVIATQRPSVDVITGVIKANIPSRISFAVSSQIDSRTILDSTGAEKLLGRGDMLYSPQGLNKPMRVQGCLVSDDEVQRVISFWKAQGSPEYLDPEGFTSVASSGKTESSGLEDELFEDAGRLIITTGMASVSFLQRRLKLGYARAARLIDLLEENGVVGGYEGSKPRQVLLTIEEFEELFEVRA